MSWLSSCYLCQADSSIHPGHMSKDEVPVWVCDVCWRARMLEHDARVTPKDVPK